jgi:hypothetical protein
MKTKTSLLSLVVILLTSCAPASLPAPTETATVVPTATTIVLPTETYTPAPTATIPPVVIPDYMQDYVDRGFDKMSGNGILYVVIDETKIHYAPEEGIIFQERIIRDWFEVTYIENGLLKHGIILDFVGRGGNDVHKTLNRFVDSRGASEGPFIPLNAMVRTIRTDWADRTKGDYPIAIGILGVKADDVNGQVIFGDIFPPGATSVRIPGIGDVLPITQLDYVDPLAAPTSKP